MKFVLHPDAAEEIKQASAFYKQQQAGLEKRFIETLEESIDKVRAHPYRYRQIEADVRKYRLLHFPYALIYQAKAEHLEIIAVMHLRKQPDYWQTRLG